MLQLSPSLRQLLLRTPSIGLDNGSYTNPASGDTPFETYAEDWRKARTNDESTAISLELEFRLHVYSDPGRDKCGPVPVRDPPRPAGSGAGVAAGLGAGPGRRSGAAWPMPVRPVCPSCGRGGR